jgi:hypothetical protein
MCECGQGVDQSCRDSNFKCQTVSNSSQEKNGIRQTNTADSIGAISLVGFHSQLWSPVTFEFKWSR